MNAVTPYRGRFAPTPSGPLHFGSLFAAVVSFLDARCHHGHWQLRIEDLDPPRQQVAAIDSILRCLDQHGLHWDGAVVYQSRNLARYQDRLDQLFRQGRLFWCDCTRRQLAGLPLYPGSCRAYRQPRSGCAIRLLVSTAADNFVDIFQGRQQFDLSAQYGDVVLRRRDQLFAYQLAVVCDDIDAQINHVIRGADLLTSTGWQRELYRAFAAPYPRYGHFPLLHAAGSAVKLSKQTGAAGVDPGQASRNLAEVFALMGLRVEQAEPEQMLQQAVAGYRRELLRGKKTLALSPEATSVN